MDETRRADALHVVASMQGDQMLISVTFPAHLTKEDRESVTAQLLLEIARSDEVANQFKTVSTLCNQLLPKTSSQREGWDLVYTCHRADFGERFAEALSRLLAELGPDHQPKVLH